jgi:hypothetical protein
VICSLPLEMMGPDSIAACLVSSNNVLGNAATVAARKATRTLDAVIRPMTAALPQMRCSLYRTLKSKRSYLVSEGRS